MVRLAACACVTGLALAGSGCLGGSAAPESAPRSQPASPAMHTRVTYPVGRPHGSRELVQAACPTLASCVIERVPHPAATLWTMIARRSLTCGPAGGDYHNPEAACRALAQLRRLLATTHSGCFCPAVIGPPPKAVVTIGSRRVVVPLDACTVCGLGARGAADASALTPS